MWAIIDFLKLFKGITIQKLLREYQYYSVAY